jgi:hypothetical protein
MSIDAAGIQSGDVEILKAAERYTSAIAWDPDGQDLIWAPSVDAANCDRFAFGRSGALWVGDVPREGFRSRECAITAPTPLGGTAVDAMDWK